MAIYQEKNKNKWTKDGRSWYFRNYYINIYGERKQYESCKYLTKKEARENERLWLNKSLQQDFTNTQIEFINVFEEWIQFRKMQLKETSYYSLVHRTDKYIKSFFKKYKLHSIKTNIINLWYKELEKYDYSLDYKNKLIGDLRDFLKYARDNYDFDNKVIAKLQNYRIDIPNDKLTDAQYNFWTFEEWSKFIAVVDNYEDFMMYSFLYYTGLRFGEFDALNWKDYDNINKTISVSKNLGTRVSGKKYVITTPKTKNSIRVVDLDDMLNEDLIKYKKYKIKTSYKFNEDNFIFGNINYVPATTFRRKLNKYIDIVRETDKNFKRITPHGFRHSHVSLLIDMGCDSRDVAERIGDTVEMVEKTYYHMFPKKKKSTINRLNNLKNKR